MINLSRISSEEFQTANPYPHCVIEKAVDDEYLLRNAVMQVQDVPDDDPLWKQYQARKQALVDVGKLGGNATVVAEYFNNSKFVECLSLLTGIPNLIADPEHSGAGYHKVSNGGSLGVHVDFNRLGDLYRRVNILLYLNEKWDVSWKGDLWICADGKTMNKMVRPVKIVPPTFNTMVIFECSDKSWHGHPRKISCPEKRSRLSIAAYYYTAEKPDWYTEKHSTIYRTKEL